jgi:hypothetical protein
MPSTHGKLKIFLVALKLCFRQPPIKAELYGAVKLHQEQEMQGGGEHRVKEVRALCDYSP